MEPVKACAKWLARFVVEALGLVVEATLPSHSFGKRV